MPEEIESGRGASRTGLASVLETLTAHYTFDADGRIVRSRSEGLPPRFVLGRAAEGCLWRFGVDLARRPTVELARLAARERGVRFDGELHAPPERLAALERLLSSTGPADAGDLDRPRLRRQLITRDGVVVGELWTMD
ncbi:MAG: hypothetical protein IPK00_21350 [Deltaproteobacteria bacterium]|nr:hypothetical protein [Deltaproteobacteria bacterium]